MACFENCWLCWRTDILTTALLDEIDQIAGLHADLCVISRVSALALPAEMAIRSSLRCQIIGVDSAHAPLHIAYESPQKLGHDRIANAFGARYHAPNGAIVVDLGTATHFDVITPDGTFLGGPILAGVQTMLDALTQRIPHLPAFALTDDIQPVSNSTQAALNTGAILGTAGAIEKIIAEIQKQIDFAPQIILTGGHAPLIAPHIHYDLWAPHLTLEGLCQYAILTLQREKNRISA